MTTPQRTALISGAGIAGPALAYWLTEYGFSATVVEAAPSPRTGGYKVDIRGKAMDVVEKMGLGSAVRALSTDMRGGAVVGADGRPVATMDGATIGFRAEGDDEVLRGDLARLFHDTTKDRVEYLFGDTITAIDDRDDGVRVTFEHGEDRTFDLVIGADGQHSRVRALRFGDEREFTRDLGHCVSVFSVPNHLGLDRWELVHHAPGRMVNLYSTAADDEAKAAFFFASPSSFDRRDAAAQRRIVAEVFGGMGWEVPRLLESLPGATDFYFDALAVIELPKWSRGRVALVGDAAYCASPAAGQGTSLAIVGAYVLAGELAENGHQAAFDAYQSRMRDFVVRNQALAANVKRMVPRSKTQIRVQSAMMRIGPRLPGTNFVMKKVVEQISSTANAIELPDYSAAVTRTASARRK